MEGFLGMSKKEKIMECVQVRFDESALMSACLEAISGMSKEIQKFLASSPDIPVDKLYKFVYMLGGTVGQFVMGLAISKERLALLSAFVNGFDGYVRYRMANDVPNATTFSEITKNMRAQFVIDKDKKPN